MNCTHREDARSARNIALSMLGTTLGIALVFASSSTTGRAQSNAAPATARPAETKSADAKPASAEAHHSYRDLGPYKMFTFKNATEQNDANDLQTAIRNVSTQARLYYLPSQNAIAVRAEAEDIALIEQVIADFDHARKLYRLTYTLTDIDNGKRIGVQHFTLVATSAEQVNLKQGSRVPIFSNTTSPAGSNAEYLDIGLEINARVEPTADGINLRTKVAQTSLAEEKAGASAASGDPVIRQTTFEGASVLVLGKPLVLGSLDTPGSTRRQEIEVVSEFIR